MKLPLSLGIGFSLSLVLSPVAPAADAEATQCPGKQLSQETAAGGDVIEYFSRTLSKEEYQRTKRDEIAAFKQDLETTYHLPFRTRSSKVFDIAYRIDEKKMDALQLYLEAFFAQVYPRTFKCALGQPIRIVYFESKAVYEKLTGSNAYGFYRREEKTLYTYGHSGHGTLWHEQIHAFLDQNQSCDPQEWFDEGLASFYEMAFLDSGKVIEGYANWRLPSLKQAIRDGTVAHLKDFLRQDRINEDSGLAEARFLFCYLWVHKKLIPFVQAYLYDLCPKTKGIDRGDRAIALLEELLGKDIDTINGEFQALARLVKKNQKLKQE